MLTPEGRARFTLNQRILQIGAQMHRASASMARGDEAYRRLRVGRASIPEVARAIQTPQTEDQALKGGLMWFSRRLSKEEISEHLATANRSELTSLLSSVVVEQHLNEKGRKYAAAGKKIILKHQAIFRDCKMKDLFEVIRNLIDRWPDVTSAEHALMSDLVKAHRSLQKTA